MDKVSCIICAYNEGGRIGSVLRAIEHHPHIHEVIVVDDGSTDSTAQVAAQFSGVRVIRHATNLGKSRALVTGMRSAQFDTLLLLDADLVGLTADDVSALITPVLQGVADISISIRKNSLLVYKLIGLDFVSGERAFKKTLILENLDRIAELPSFGLEVFINQLIIKQSLRVRTVSWKGVIGPRKSDKMGFVRGSVADIKMIFDILNVVSLKEIFVQNYKILSLSV